MAGLYIHIPFCKQACHYCNFHFSTSIAQKPKMLNAIAAELSLKAGKLDENISTIYFGGGTPSLLSSADLLQLFSVIDDHYTLNDDVEITLEANPDDIDEYYVNGLSGTPVNRISLGVQSFVNEDLNYMNRAHDSSEATKAIELLLKHGYQNLSVDLIYGTPTMTHDQWKTNIETLISLRIPHLSCYQLTVEPQTPLAAFIKRGQMVAPSDEEVVRQFHTLLDSMEKAGYEAYEISNYALPGYRSRHNSSYWKGTPYLGFGPSAHSFIDSYRSWNTVVNSRYMEQVEKGVIPEQTEKLSETDKYNEYILTGLRTIEGLSIERLESQFNQQYKSRLTEIKSAIDKKLIVRSGSEITLTRLGKIWCDSVSSDLMV